MVQHTMLALDNAIFGSVNQGKLQLHDLEVHLHFLTVEFTRLTMGWPLTLS